MKIFIFSLILISYFSLNAQDIPGWEKVYEGTTVVGKSEFPSESVGYAIVQPDTLLLTTDFGDTWRYVHISVADSLKITGIEDISFYSVSSGYIGAILRRERDSAVLRAIIKVTEDGKEFKVLYLPDSIIAIESIKFLSENYGVCVFVTKYIPPYSGSPLMVTSDGGVTWSKDIFWEYATVLGGVDDKRYLTVLDSQTWFLRYRIPCGHELLCARIARTTDAGATWNAYPSVGEPYPLRSDDVYNMMKYQYYDKLLDKEVYSPIINKTSAVVLDSFAQIGNFYFTSVTSNCREGTVVRLLQLLSNVMPSYLLITKDSCRTWVMIELQAWGRYLHKGNQAIVASKSVSYLTAKKYDTTNKIYSGSVIYRTKNLLSGIRDTKSKESTLSIFPNPADGTLRWNIPDGTATITDAVGRQVLALSASAQQADVSGLAAGVYVLTVRTSAGAVSRTFVKE